MKPIIKSKISHSSSVKWFSEIIYGWQTWGELPSRFTERQLEIYRASTLSSVQNINCCSGMKLEFVTAEQEISFSFQCGNFLRSRVHFDFYENGQYTETCFFPDDTASGRVIYRKKSEGETRFEIYFPNSCDTCLSDLWLGEWKRVEAPARKYIAFGDSITQGLDAEQPSFTYPTLLARKKQLDLLNQGVGGYVFDSHVIERNPAFLPDIITVAYGVNDCLLIDIGERTFHRTEQEAGAFLETLQKSYPKAQIVVLTPIPWSWERKQLHRENMKKMRGMLTSLAQEAGCRVIDGRTLVPPQQEYFASDGVHPNKAGFCHYAACLWEQLDG